uniref:Uncharacterized protein n=1 Tax=Zea mays TaxID=4577 RepID=A0A804QQV0_MAIZE
MHACMHIHHTAGPGEKERMVELVEDVDDDVVVGGAVDPGARELAVDEDDLLGHSQQGPGPVRHLPLEEQVGVLGPGQGRQRRHDQQHAGGNAHRRRRHDSPRPISS